MRDVLLLAMASLSKVRHLPMRMFEHKTGITSQQTSEQHSSGNQQIPSFYQPTKAQQDAQDAAKKEMMENKDRNRLCCGM